MVIVGHNGAGKSTCFRKYVSFAFEELNENHIDPDAIERTIRQDLAGEEFSDSEFSMMASDEATRQRRMRLANRESFSFETVFSDEVGDKLGFLQEAVAAGYTVALLAVGLDSPEKSRDRVALRVQRNGHSVPEDRIYRRYPRVIDNISQGVLIASVALVVDNSLDDPSPDGTAYIPFVLFAGGVCIEIAGQVPDWWKHPDNRNMALAMTIENVVRQLSASTGLSDTQFIGPMLDSKPDSIH